MGQITWNTDVNAPCCPGEIIDDDTGRTIPVQTDWGYPGVAGSFGWSLRVVQRNKLDCDSYEICGHSGTDGTIDCPECGITVGEFIEAAREWLEDNDGATADDPGYFQE